MSKIMELVDKYAEANSLLGAQMYALREKLAYCNDAWDDVVRTLRSIDFEATK